MDEDFKNYLVFVSDSQKKLEAIIDKFLIENPKYSFKELPTFISSSKIIGKYKNIPIRKFGNNRYDCALKKG